MNIQVPKPKSEKEQVNLYATVIECIRKVDQDIDNYLFEANICDDCEIEEIIEMLSSYYCEVREMELYIEKKMRIIGH